ncbi:MAG: PIN domain-containing protein [Candidatus Thorarchaeota archaeon]
MTTKLLLDSSFFFPLIGVEVRNCPKEAILELLRTKNVQILRSELVIFELSAKGTKLVNENRLEIEDLIDGLNTIQSHPDITTLPIYYSEIQILSAVFRQNHSDFIDCLTLASAVYYSDVFLTLDSALKEKYLEIWEGDIRKIRSKFNVLLWQEYQPKSKEITASGP